MWAFGSFADTVKHEMFFGTNNNKIMVTNNRKTQQRILKAARENVGSHSVKSLSRSEHVNEW